MGRTLIIFGGVSGGHVTFAIFCGVVLSVSEYLHLGTKLVGELGAADRRLILASEFATAVAVWVFLIWLIPVTARIIVAVCDHAKVLSDRLGVWIRQMAVRLLQKMIELLSKGVPRA